MKLFLSSLVITNKQADRFLQLVGKKNPADVNLIFIENAADVYKESAKWWVQQTRDSFADRGFKLSYLDLREYKGKPKELRAQLAKADVIWLGGGNTYYLRWILHDTGADAIIADLVKSGKVYGGGSAGAIVAGPTTKFFDGADDPAKAPQVIDEGMGLTQIVPVPHWDGPNHKDIMKDANDKLIAADYKTVTLTDEQALLIDGDHHEVL